MNVRGRVIVAVFVGWLSSPVLAQQSAAPPQSTLAKQLSNPVSSLVSVPFQFNWDQNVGPSELTRFTLNVQPIMPFALNPHLNLVVRLIMPFIGQPPLSAGGTPTFGMGDITSSFFFSRDSTNLPWGIGPVFVLPSTSEPTLGSGKWSAGPTVVALKQTGPWTVGVLWNQYWSFSGDPSRSNVNQMLLQPFFAYQATPTVTLHLTADSTANWTLDDDAGRWSVPIIASVSKLASLGQFPASFQLGVGGFAVHPDSGPTWKLRGVIVLLLPKQNPN